MDVVLVTPQIPQNIGSIARTCAATNTPLHLIEPLGFDISEKAARRAGLDYWPYVSVYTHPDLHSYISKHTPHKLWFLTKFASKPYFQADFKPSDAIVFGDEVKGLGQEFLNKQDPEQCLQIPMDCEHVRSLNLSNAVSIVLYEARRQWASKLASASQP